LLAVLFYYYWQSISTSIYLWVNLTPN
jgi:hypothetical protein